MRDDSTLLFAEEHVKEGARNTAEEELDRLLQSIKIVCMTSVLKQSYEE